MDQVEVFSAPTILRPAIAKWAVALAISSAPIGLVSCSPARQTADNTFDTSVARPAFTDSHPAVLFDEAHRNIHKTGGLYKPFARLIANDGYRVEPNRKVFTPSVLADYRILVIANALGSNDANDGPAFTDSECDAVADWVRSGGSLLLITDHAPTGAAAESLARRFGVEMTKGMVEDEKNSDVGDSSQLIFSRENGLLAEHPILAGRDGTEAVHRVMTFTGQGLRGPKDSTALLKLEKLGGDTRVVITYGDPSPAKGLGQGIALQYGKGRVVVLGEAAMFSAQLDGKTKQPFGMNVKGIDNRQMVLNTMHWLSGIL